MLLYGDFKEVSHSGFPFSLWTLYNKASIIAGERRRGTKRKEREKEGERWKEGNGREAGQSNHLEWMQQEREI